MDRPGRHGIARTRPACTRRAPEGVLGKKEARVDEESRLDHAALAAVAVLDRDAERIDPHDRAAPHDLDPTLLQAGIRRTDVTGASQLRADDVVRRDEADRRAVGREKLRNPDADRTADRVPDDDRARSWLGDLALGREDLGGRGDGSTGRRFEVPATGTRARAVHDRPFVPVELLQGHFVARLDVDPGAPALGLEPVHKGPEALSPGRAGGDSHHATEDLLALDEGDLMADRGRDPSAFEAGRAAADDEDMRLPRGGSLPVARIWPVDHRVRRLMA